MRVYNKENFIVFNTIQMYRHDRLPYFYKLIEMAKENNFNIGIKIVRGAYMEKERERAEKMGYPSPIHVSKQKTDEDYNKAIQLSVENIDCVSVCVATHNEQSILHLTQLMARASLANNHPRIYAAQLFGMSDNISYNLSDSGYNVVKYVPYGKVRTVIPYLMRRAAENTSVAGQTSRELKLIKEELERRKKEER